MAQTKLANIVNPEVMAQFVDKKLVDKIKFAPLATIDYTLQGRPGDTITLPSWNYIGDAATLNEGVSLTASLLSAGTVNATIHKVAKGVARSLKPINTLRPAQYGQPLLVYVR